MGRVLIGGVGYRWQRDASLGLVATDLLAASALPAGVEAADLGYGALLVAQDLAAAEPPYSALVLIAAPARGRPPGTIDRRRWDGQLPPGPELQELVREAGAGVVHVDHLLAIAGWSRALPPEVHVIEVEPYEQGPGDGLSEPGERLLHLVLAAAREAAAPAEVA